MFAIPARWGQGHPQLCDPPQRFVRKVMPFFTGKCLNEGTPDPIPADRNGGVCKVKATVAHQKQQSVPNFL